MGHVIDEDSGFAFLDYRGSPSYQEPEVHISVKRDAFWSYCGPLLGGEDELPANLHEWASAALSSSLVPLLLPFLAFTNEFAAKNGLDHYWLTIRATKATSEFDKPRWHTDDMFFRSGSGGLGAQSTETSGAARPLDLQTDWKLCGTLLGPSTMFIPGGHQPAARDIQRSTKKALATDHSCTSIRYIACAATADAVRDELGNKLSCLGTIQAVPGGCSFFRIGPDRGAVHSEPSMSGGDRIFVNVVPGKKAELGDLMAKWGMEFPRAWWIAPNMLRTHLG
ncbi:hypothetical protein DL769_006957 [Monosporascus sp. CRB-8-3]|nr:hypothetical protein DL769_006957 [Monosporascus sp. CRB-8-3]